ncbi:MAG: hypothetical protein EKE20_14600 [Candidatus Symbiopectobacterium sp. Dall1.0]|nr:hypothetical protein [Candidatus Symbiopectobacterium sp. Dall1.0]
MKDDRVIALEIAKQWFRELDASYLAKEDIIVHWKPFTPESKRGEWIKLKPHQAVRIVKSTRAVLKVMRYINVDILRAAAQEDGRMYVQGITTKGVAPTEYFNFNRTETFTRFELLISCVIKILVGHGWNTRIIDLSKIINTTFSKKGFKILSANKRNVIIDNVAQESGVIVRGRLDRLFVNGVGRYVAIQIEGLKSIKLDYDEATIEKVADDALRMFESITEPENYKVK